jgi:hypothetical protein
VNCLGLRTERKTSTPTPETMPMCETPISQLRGFMIEGKRPREKTRNDYIPYIKTFSTFPDPYCGGRILIIETFKAGRSARILSLHWSR